MKRICPKCQFIGSGFGGSIIAGGVIIGTGLINYGILVPHSIGLALFNLIGLILIGISGIIRSFRTGKICPSCKHMKMLSIDEPKAQEIINKHGLTIEDTVTNTCMSCSYRGIPNKAHPKLLNIIALVYGLIALLVSLLFYTPIAIFGSLIILGSGIYGVIWNISTNNKCPTCNSKTYIPINSPET